MPKPAHARHAHSDPRIDAPIGLAVDRSVAAGNARRAAESWPLRALWRLCNTLQFAYTLLWTASMITCALVAHRFGRDRDRALRMACRQWAPGLLWGARARLVVEGADAVDWSKPYMVVANHQSMIDICALFRAIPAPLRFLLKQEMTRVPFVGRYAKTTGMLFIDRDSRRAGPKMLREAAQLLRGGANVCIFPEGTRSRDGHVEIFKGGAFQSAIDAGVDVVPIAISGAGAVLPPDGFFRVRPGTITVRIGRPISAVNGERQALAKEAYAALALMMTQERGTP